MIKRSVVGALATLFAIAGGIAISAYAMPWRLDVIEARITHAPLEVENVMRMVLAYAGFLLVGGALFWLTRRGTGKHGVVFLFSLVSFVSLGIIFFFDQSHTLMEEFSWIRYPTAAYLVSAAVGACAIGIRFGAGNPIVRIFWLLAGSAFLFAGLDELFEIHELIGKAIETRFSLPHWISDYITVGYALAGAAVAALAARPLLRWYRATDPFPITLCVVGIVLYGFSTLFDTVDLFLVEKIRSMVNILTTSGFVVPDAWTAFLEPRLFFNSIEEIFEMLAAQLFCAATLLTLLKDAGGLRVSLPNHALLRTWVPAIIWATVPVFLVLSFPNNTPRSPIRSGDVIANTVAGHFDGLSHADDLATHPSWGVVVANEGKSSVYQWNGQRLIRIPDPDKVLRDPDSLTVTHDAIIVSDGNGRAIRKYTHKDGWSVLFSEKDGLKHPEGIVVVANSFFVIDGAAIKKLVAGVPVETWTPSHPQWREPEGIVYDERRKKFLITDDATGAVFAGTFGGSVEKIAQLSHPEDIAIDQKTGSALITDNGWGSIIELSSDGSTRERARLRRAYRDLQGVVVTDGGDLFVISADGHDGKEFMPSLLTKLTPL